MAKYNGHKNYNHWNVSLWISNDEGLYSIAKDAVRYASNRDAAARQIVDDLNALGITKTPDGAPYTFTTVRAAISDL
jgi:predicted NUDIX family NTP pyrophosphohydrolase